jgi:hypothetical protein
MTEQSGGPGAVPPPPGPDDVPAGDAGTSRRRPRRPRRMRGGGYPARAPSGTPWTIPSCVSTPAPPLQPPARQAPSSEAVDAHVDAHVDDAQPPGGASPAS